MSKHLEQLVITWAEDRGIMSKGTVEGQLEKLREELEELSDAICDDNKAEIIDAIGDMQVVLIILAALYNLSATDCLMSAYSVIAKRRGRMENGQFKKEEENV